MTFEEKWYHLSWTDGGCACYFQTRICLQTLRHGTGCQASRPGLGLVCHLWHYALLCRLRRDLCHQRGWNRSKERAELCFADRCKFIVVPFVCLFVCFYLCYLLCCFCVRMFSGRTTIIVSIVIVVVGGSGGGGGGDVSIAVQSHIPYKHFPYPIVDASHHLLCTFHICPLQKHFTLYPLWKLYICPLWKCYIIICVMKTFYITIVNTSHSPIINTSHVPFIKTVPIYLYSRLRRPTTASGITPLRSFHLRARGKSHHLR